MTPLLEQLKICDSYVEVWSSQVAIVVKNPPANARGIGDVCSISGLGRSPGWGLGNPLQYSCLEKSMDRGAWQAAVYEFTKSRAWHKWLSMQAQSVTNKFKGCKGSSIFILFIRTLNDQVNKYFGYLICASLIAQLVKNLPAMQETPVRFLGWEHPLEKG